MNDLIKAAVEGERNVRRVQAWRLKYYLHYGAWPTGDVQAHRVRVCRRQFADTLDATASRLELWNGVLALAGAMALVTGLLTALMYT